MALLEIFVCKLTLIIINRVTAGALHYHKLGKRYNQGQFSRFCEYMPCEERLQDMQMLQPGLSTHVTPIEVSALQHEVWDHSMKPAAFVSVAMLTCAKLTKVCGGLRDNIVVEVKFDAADFGYEQHLGQHTASIQIISSLEKKGPEVMIARGCDHLRCSPAFAISLVV
jgi:hypothetical protein